MPEEDEFTIRQFLMAELFGITLANDDEMNEAKSHMTEAQWTTINGQCYPCRK